MFSATNKGEVKQKKQYTSDICGPSWWAMLHGTASGIKAGCPTCGEEAESLMRYAHDLVNVKHGKPVFAPADGREWSEIALQLAQSLKVPMSNSDIPTGQNMTLGQTNCTPLPQGQATIDQAMEFAKCQAVSDLGRYKFERFGYHAANWVNLNRVRKNRITRSPFKALVESANQLQKQIPMLQRKRGARCPLDGKTAKEIPGEIDRFLRDAKKAIAGGEFAKFAKSVESMCNTQQQRFAQDVTPVKISGKCDSEGCDLSATAGGKTLEKEPRIKVPVGAMDREGLARAVAEAREQLNEALAERKPKKKEPLGLPEVKNLTFADVDGERIELRTEIFSIKDVIASTNENTGKPRKGYPGWLQPRDRSRAANLLQIRNMAQNLFPDMLLTDYHTLGKGAPVVAVRPGQKNGGVAIYVVSGNGRAMALKLARTDFKEEYQKYKSQVEQLTSWDGRRPTDPIVVRVITGEPSDERLREIAELGNVSAAIATSTVEQAAIDSGKMTAEFVSGLEPLEDESANIQDTIKAMKNRAWVTSFLALVPKTEVAALVDDRGSLNESGVRRVVMALSIWTFGVEDGPRLTDIAFESIDDEARNIITGVLRTVPRLAQNMAMLQGYVDNASPERMTRATTMMDELNISPQIAQAVLRYISFKRQGLRIDEALLQVPLEMTDRITGVEKSLLQMFDRNKRSAVKIATSINDYLEFVQRLPNPNQLGFDISDAGEIVEVGDAKIFIEKAFAVGSSVRGQKTLLEGFEMNQTSVIQNKRLTAADRRRLKPSQFACPDQRAYPINDKGHIISALGRYRQADTLKCKGGAKRICTAAKKAKIHTEVCPL